MLKKWLAMLVTSMTLVLLTACEQVTPEQYFDRAVLSTNGLQTTPIELFKKIQSDKAKGQLLWYSAETNKMEPMSSAEEWTKNYLNWITEALGKVQQLKPDEDSRTIVEQSLKTFQAANQIYQNDFVAIVREWEQGASPQEIESKMYELQQKYVDTVLREHDELIALAKPYAKKHDINVRWE